MARIKKAVWKDFPSVKNLYADFEWEVDGISGISRIGAIKRAIKIIIEYDKYYVAEEEYQIVGMACFVPSNEIRYFDSTLRKEIELKGGVIWNGFVKKEYRRHKICSLLLTKIEEDAKQVGLPYLYTISNSPGAIELIKRREYVEVGTELMTEKMLGHPKTIKCFVNN